jgi:hypothetical protein
MDLIKYFYECIKPNDTTEYVESIIFQKNLYDNLIQDGLYICKEISNKDKNDITDYVKIGEFYIIRKIIREIAWLNNGFFEWSFDENPIYRRLIPPPVETVKHSLIIYNIMNEMLRMKKNLTYIEFGVRWGDNFYDISLLNKNGTNIGVDINLMYMDKVIPVLDNQNINYKFYEMSTDKFCNTLLPELIPDIVFIDADHKADTVIQDFEYTFKHLSINGYIILHDTYPCSPEFLDKNASYDCYKTPLYIKEKYIKNRLNKLELLTLPLNPGVSIIRKLEN